MDNMDTEKLYRRFAELKERRSLWENLWESCYEYALPQREGFFSQAPASRKADKLFDATAADAVDQLAASMFAELTPPWSRWFGLASGTEIAQDEQKKTAGFLEQAAEIMQYHFDRSNFAVEVHQCYLDLVSVGTASLLFEEAKIGENSAFKFTAVPLRELYVEEAANGRLETTFRASEVTFDVLKSRFPNASLNELLQEKAGQNPEVKVKVIEAVIPKDAGGYDYVAMLCEDSLGIYGDKNRQILKEGVFENSPFINFRWQKVPGEVYGRSPVMKALPDIKTANKVVELILKNAAISVTGIWQAEDDGVLNPANIRLVPGAIIPKAVGSKGLTPLEAPGNFDVSQLVLTDLRQRINHALLADRLSLIDAPSMTATEVLERSAEMVRILGATYGRLQSELLTPLIMRALAILRRRGEISSIYIDGRLARLQYQSPLARQQAQKDAGNMLSFLGYIGSMGAEGAAVVNMAETARWLGKILGVPPELIREEGEPASGANVLADLAKGVLQNGQ